MPRYTVVLSKLAHAEFESVMRADRKLGRQIAHAIDRLAQQPDLGEFLKGERKGYRKYRTGDYRIIYRTEHAQLLMDILTIANRKNAYR